MFRSPVLLALALLVAPLVALLAAVGPPASPPSAAGRASDGPTYTAGGQLAFPVNYHEWVFLGAGLDMSYDKSASAGSAHSTFNTVFANPAAYAKFQQTGHWPEGTELVLENRGAVTDASINRHGKTMSAELTGLEVHVLDSAHSPSGWTFYSFDNESGARPIPTSADCYSCHQQHAAVDTTFVQFYPTLLAVAREKHTLAPAYLKAEHLTVP